MNLPFMKKKKKQQQQNKTKYLNMIFLVQIKEMIFSSTIVSSEIDFRKWEP